MSVITTGTDDKLELLRRTICKGCTTDEMELFAIVCKRTGLDPFMKQIYPISRFSGVEKKMVMSIQTSIDGFRLIAERTGCYSPGREATHVYDNGKLMSATAYIKKMTKDGTWHEVAATAFYDEYCQTAKDKNTGISGPTQFWTKMPHVMLAKCAESLALRKAFPAEMSGIYTKEEMEQADPIQEKPLELHEASIIPSEDLMLTDTQRYTLSALLAEFEGSEKWLCEKFELNSIHDMNQKQFAHFMNLFEKRRAAKEQK